MITQPPLPQDCEVLLVDDDKNVVMVIGDYLEGRGVRVARATGGLQALELVQSHPDIKLAVVDYDMPGMNGMAVLEKLNVMREQGRAMQVIFLTAQSSSKLALELLRKQVFYYVSKPVNLHQLVKILQDAHLELVFPGQKPDHAETLV